MKRKSANKKGLQFDFNKRGLSAGQNSETSNILEMDHYQVFLPIDFAAAHFGTWRVRLSRFSIDIHGEGGSLTIESGSLICSLLYIG
jgi:hypothetical protein